MREEIELYIKNEKVEVSTDFSILMSYDVENLKNPTAILNSYSKTIRLEGTNQNNKIFSNLWDVNRIIDGNSAIDFDPSIKNPFQLFVNGDKIQEGYCKLDKIELKDKVVYYNLTLYGGIGDFFYGLAYNEDGSKRTLADLDYGGGDTEFTVEQKTTTVKSAWEYLRNYYLDPSPGYVYDKLNFALCNEGVPEGNFDANKCLVEMYQNPFGVTAPAEIGPSNPNGWILAELPQPYTMLETRDIRASLLRPVFRFKYLFQAICDPRQNGGYTVNLDPSFFSKENNYYFNAWMTLPNLQNINSTTTKINQKVNYNDTLFKEGETVTIPITLEKTAIDYTKGTITVPYQLSAAYSVPGGKYTRIQSDWNEYPSSGGRRYYYSNYYVQLLCLDEYGSMRYCTDVYRFHSLKSSFDDNDFGFVNEYQSNVVDKKGWWRWKDDQTYEFESKTPLVLKIEKMRMLKNYRFEIRITRRSINNDPNFSFPSDTMYKESTKGSGDDKFHTNIINAPVTFIKRFDEATGNSGDYSEEATSKYMLSKIRLMTSDKTPLDYLLSYTKMFGLMFVKDPSTKRIDIMRRETFYSRYDYVDLSGKVDRSRPYVIYPLSFDNKWMNFTQELIKSDLGDRYLNNTGNVYGEQKVDTNYSFNNSSKNLLDGNAFRNCVSMRNRCKYNVNYKPGVIPTFLDGAKLKVWDENENLKDANIATVQPESSSRYVPIYEDGYSNLVTLDLQKERKGLDGKDILIFNDGEVNTFDLHMDYYYAKMTDDNLDMLKLNNGKACWQSAKNRGWDCPTVPQFSRYYTLGLNIYKTFEMGTPSETYAYDLNYGDNSSIYEQYWKDFIHDQYLTDTRIVECYVLLDQRVIENYLRKIFYFDNAYWALISITDYNVCAYTPTKCKFIKINNLSSYKG